MTSSAHVLTEHIRTALSPRFMYRIVLFLLVVCFAAGMSACKDEPRGGSGQGGTAAKGKAEKPAPPKENEIRLIFTYGSEKEAWVNEVTGEFNRKQVKTSGGKVVQVDAIPVGSGEIVDEILAGRRKTDIISPASAAFIKLGNAKSQQKTGKDLVGSTENLVLSPVIIAMWKPMAEAIGWGQKPLGWSDILELAESKEGWAKYNNPQWGSFKFGHTHPKFSNSGLISLFAEVYAGADKVSGLTLEDVQDPKVAEYLGKIEKAVVHYGSSTGFFGRKMFNRGPGYLSAAVLYENMVIESYSPKYKLPFPVVAIYPKEGTFWSDHPAGIVEREWVTPERREAAKLYLDFLLAEPQQKKAMKHGFRPGLVDIPLASPIDKEHGVDPQEPKTTLEVPNVAVMDAIIKLWEENKKHSDVVLVLDVSGSMKHANKLEHAKKGAKQLVGMLGPEDKFSLITFSNKPTWVLKDVLVKDGKDKALSMIDGLFADGGTALYDAIGLAYEQLSTKEGERRIRAVVALTDGVDNKSTLKLNVLKERIQADNESKTVRVFTIGYGPKKDIDESVLKALAEATEVKYFHGKPENIRKVFIDISTFF